MILFFVNLLQNPQKKEEIESLSEEVKRKEEEHKEEKVKEKGKAINEEVCQKGKEK